MNKTENKKFVPNNFKQQQDLFLFFLINYEVHTDGRLMNYR